MFAVIRTGGKQYRVAPDDVIQVEKLAGEAGDIVQFGEVLMLGGNGTPQVGAPRIAGASVAAEVLEQTRAAKIVVFKKKRRKGYRRTQGHRQHLTSVRITEILTDGKTPSKTKAEPRPAKAKSDEDEMAAGTPAAKAAPAKQAPAKKAASPKTAAKAPAKKAPAQKAATKKAAAKDAPARKAAAKKAPAKETPAKKTAAKKAPAKKAPAKKA